MRASFLVTTTLCGILFLAGTAQAQLINRPFSFNTPSGGVGMSIGGRQAILNDKILGSRPDNLVRGADGQLITVISGPGRSAISSIEGGGTIPGYRGRSFRDGNPGMSAGAFNAYFVPGSSGGGVGPVLESGATINTWTGRIITGMPVSYTPSSSVDTWTGMASY